MQYLQQSHALVERLYQIEKAGGFRGAGSKEAIEFTEQRLAAERGRRSVSPDGRTLAEVILPDGRSLSKQFRPRGNSVVVVIGV